MSLWEKCIPPVNNQVFRSCDCAFRVLEWGTHSGWRYRETASSSAHPIPRIHPPPPLHHPRRLRPLLIELVPKIVFSTKFCYQILKKTLPPIIPLKISDLRLGQKAGKAWWEYYWYFLECFSAKYACFCYYIISKKLLNGERDIAFKFVWLFQNKISTSMELFSDQ